MEAGERLLNQVLAVDESAEAEEWALREGMRLGGGAGAGAGTGSQLAPVSEFGESTSVNGRAGPGAEGGSLLDRDDAASTISGATGAGGVSRSRTMSRPSAAAPPPHPLPLPTGPADDTRFERSASNTKTTSKLGSKLSSFLGGGSGGGSKRDRSSSIPNSAKYANFAAPDAPPVPPVQTQAQPAFDRRATDASSASGGINDGDLLGGGGGGERAGSGAGAGALAPPLQPESRSDKRKSLMPGSGSGSGGGLFRRASRGNTLDDVAGQGQGSAQYAQGLSAEPMEQEQGGGGVGGAQRVDAEGYSVPPEGYDRAIGDSGSRGAGRNLMDDEDDEDDAPLGNRCALSFSLRPPPALTARANTEPGPPSHSVPKLSIAPSPLPPSSPTLPQEDEQARLVALQSVKSALGAPPASAGLGRRTTTNRGRRGTGDPARNTLYAPERQDSAMSGASEDETPLAQVAEKHRRAPPPPPAARAASPPSTSLGGNNGFVASPAAGAALADPFGGSSAAAAAAAAPPPLSPAGSAFGASAFSPSATGTPGRAMSVMSGTSSLGPSTSSTSGAPRVDPFAGSTTPGLRASVTESVSALLKGGEVTRALVTGEVALSHRASSPSSDAAGEVQLRVTGLESADKVAPNGAFLHSSSGGAGEYALAPAFAASTGGTTTPVLKYALSPAASNVVPPLSLKPTWRVEPGLARAIVAYGPLAGSPLLASASASGGSAPQVDDVRVELHLAQGTITSFQAKPAATILPGGRGIVFALPGAGAAGAVEGKLLASLTVEGGAVAQPGNVVAHWVVRGATAGGVGVEVIGGGDELAELRRETVSGKYLAA